MGEDIGMVEGEDIGNDIWDLLSCLYGWPKRKDEKGEEIVDKKELKRVEEAKIGVMERRSDYRCAECKGVMEIVEFVFGNITVVKVKPCKLCNELLSIKEHSKGYDKGYAAGQDDK